MHVVSAIFPVDTYDKYSHTYTEAPTHYECSEEDFTGTLEQACAHIVEQQFTVREPVKKIRP